MSTSNTKSGNGGAPVMPASDKPAKRTTLTLGINISSEALNKAMKNAENAQKSQNEESILVGQGRVSDSQQNHLLTQEEIKKSIALSVNNADRSHKIIQPVESQVDLVKLSSSKDEVEAEPQKGGLKEQEKNKKPINIVVDIGGSVEGGKGKPVNGHKLYGSGKNKSQHHAGRVKVRKTEELSHEQEVEARSAKSIDDIDMEEYSMLYGGNIVVRSPVSRQDSFAPKKKVRHSTGVGYYKNRDSSVQHVIIKTQQVSVEDLATSMKVKSFQLIKWLSAVGVGGLRESSLVDADTAELVASERGYEVIRKKSEVEVLCDEMFSPLPFGAVSSGFDGQLSARPPVVTVMGHVDHGKTSILDAIRNTSIASKESGGITQHIGAYTATMPDGRVVTFIDTPGHAAFSEMRSRGAKITDIVILVVAADDGVMQQTIEAIQHIKAFGAPVVVAINKMDKVGVNIEKIKQDLARYEIISDEYGGDVMFVPVSALKKLNLDKLLEAVLLQADVLQLKASFNGCAKGAVIESRTDKFQGNVATLLVQNGVLRIGDVVACGETFGKIRAMKTFTGQLVKEATPAMPVEVLGLHKCPSAGDRFLVVKSEKDAVNIAEFLSEKRKVSERKTPSDVVSSSLQRLSSVAASNTLNVIIKADVSGSLEAVRGVISKIHHDEVGISIIHSGVGAVTDYDIALAKTANTKIFAFNVDIPEKIVTSALRAGVEIKMFDIIYNLEEELKNIMSSMLSPIVTYVYTGRAEVRKVFDISRLGKIAGCYTSDGLITRGNMIKVLRGGNIVCEGKLTSLQSAKEVMKEVHQGQECGIQLDKFNDFLEGDTLECYKVTEEKRTVV